MRVAIDRDQRASMGPPLDGGGDLDRVRASAAESAALQWGRRSMAAETRLAALRRRRRCDASMGPPLDGGGDHCNETSAAGEPCALQWGRRSMAAETPAVSRATFDLWRRLQWGRRSMAAETHAGDAGVDRLVGASMGPPLDGGGDSGAPTRACTCRGRFNGAAARWRRRPGVLEPSQRPGRLASMGPPLDGGGDTLTIQDLGTLAGRLQWGRRSMAAETRQLSSLTTLTAVGFNGAAARWRRRRGGPPGSRHG